MSENFGCGFGPKLYLPPRVILSLCRLFASNVGGVSFVYSLSVTSVRSDST